MARSESNSRYFSPQRQLSSDSKAVAKRVSFLDSDAVVIIPNDDSFTISSCRPRARETCSFMENHGGKDITKGCVKVSPGRQAASRLRCSTAEKNAESVPKGIKSILKRSSTESSIQRTGWNSVDNVDGSYSQSNSFDLKPQVDFRFTSGSDTPIKNQFIARKTLPIHSEYDKFASSKETAYNSPQLDISARVTRNNFSPSRTIYHQRQPSTLSSRLQSYHQQPSTPYSQCTKATPKSLSLAGQNSMGSKSVRQFVGNNINVSDLYPAITNFQKNSNKQLLGPNHNKISIHSRYVTARERISRTGNYNNRLSTRVSTNFEDCPSPGLSGVAETSLLNRLRKFEHSEPYIAWQAVAKSSIHSSPVGRPSTMGSYHLSRENAKRTSFERVYVPKDSINTQYY